MIRQLVTIAFSVAAIMTGVISCSNSPDQSTGQSSFLAYLNAIRDNNYDALKKVSLEVMQAESNGSGFRDEISRRSSQMNELNIQSFLVKFEEEDANDPVRELRPMRVSVSEFRIRAITNENGILDTVYIDVASHVKTHLPWTHDLVSVIVTQEMKEKFPWVTPKVGDWVVGYNK